MSKATVEAPILDEHCAICGRVRFDYVVRTGYGHWRHDACEIGSNEWKEYFLALDPEKKKRLQSFFDFYYPQVEVKPKGKPFNLLDQWDEALTKQEEL